MAYWANLLIGPDATSADRDAVQTAFQSLMSPAPSEPQMSKMFAEQGQGSPRLILDSAVVNGVTMTLVVFIEQGTVPNVGISTSDPSVGTGSIALGTGSGPEEPVDTTMSGWVDGAVVWGTASPEVARAEIKTQEGKTFPATIVDIPGDLAGGRDAVWGFVQGSTRYAQAIGYDASGSLLGSPTYATAPPDVIATGHDPVGGDWTL